MKILALGSFLIAQGGLAVVPGDRSLLEYAVTQGGLLLFSLVLLYFYRKDMARIQAKDEEKISVLTTLVSSVETAITTNNLVIATQSSTIDRLERSLEAVEQRRGRHT